MALGDRWLTVAFVPEYSARIIPTFIPVRKQVLMMVMKTHWRQLSQAGPWADAEPEIRHDRDWTSFTACPQLASNPFDRAAALWGRYGAWNSFISCLPQCDVSGFSDLPHAAPLLKPTGIRVCEMVLLDRAVIFSKLQSELSLELEAIDCKGLLTAEG